MDDSLTNLQSSLNLDQNEMRNNIGLSLKKNNERYNQNGEEKSLIFVELCYHLSVIIRLLSGCIYIKREFCDKNNSISFVLNVVA